MGQQWWSVLGFIIAATVFAGAVVLVALTKRREWAQEQAQREINRAWNTSMSNLIGHLVLRGYDAQLLSDGLNVRRHGAPKMMIIAPRHDFSPTTLLAALKDLPPASVPVEAPQAPTETATKT